MARVLPFSLVYIYICPEAPDHPFRPTALQFGMSPPLAITWTRFFRFLKNAIFSTNISKKPWKMGFFLKIFHFQQKLVILRSDTLTSYLFPILGFFEKSHFFEKKIEKNLKNEIFLEIFHFQPKLVILRSGALTTYFFLSFSFFGKSHFFEK